MHSMSLEFYSVCLEQVHLRFCGLHAENTFFEFLFVGLINIDISAILRKGFFIKVKGNHNSQRYLTAFPAIVNH